MVTVKSLKYISTSTENLTASTSMAVGRKQIWPWWLLPSLHRVQGKHHSKWFMFVPHPCTPWLQTLTLSFNCPSFQTKPQTFLLSSSQTILETFFLPPSQCYGVHFWNWDWLKWFPWNQTEARIWKKKLQFGSPGAGLIFCLLGHEFYTNSSWPAFPACSCIWFYSRSNEYCSSSFLLGHLLY